MAESSGMTLMDLISADPTPVPAQSTSSSASTTASQPSPASSSAASHLNHPMSTKTTLGERKSKRATLMQIQNDTISVAKAALNPVKANIMPQRQRQKKKPVSYSQLARSIHELAATLDQKSSQKQLVNHVFPKLAVYNSVDPSLAPSLLMLNQQCEDRNVLRYVYYYLARILSDTGMTPGGGIPTPNWDALADIDAGGGVTRADVVPRIVNQLTTEATNSEFEFHARRLQALKALTYSPSGNSELLSKLYEIVFGILEKVGDVPHKRKKGVFGTKGGDKESIMRSNLQYAAMSALRRLPLDPGNPLFLHRAAQGVSFADPVAVRHSLEILSELATRDPYTVAMTLEKLASPAGPLQDILHMNDVLARVSLARLCHSISRARALDERPDIRSQFNSILYQLLLDPSERVCYEAILCILGKYDSTERMDERAAGWYRLTREILKLPEAPSLSSKDKSHKTKRPQPLIKLVMRRLESSFRSFSRPVLHAAARVVQEMGKSRAAAFAMGLQDIDESVHVNAFSDALDDAETNENSHPEGIRRTSSISAGPGRNDTIASLLAALMEVVRTTVACECVYVRAMVIKALIWMQSPDESLDELKSIIASELSDPSWPAALVNDVLLTLHARFKATPDMAVILLEIARIFATKVPGKIDADVLQLLWKTCLVGAGPDGKHTALEAVTIVLDLPPPQPGSMAGLTSIDRVSASDPKSALALQKLVQAAVWFLGENANYAASEYAWESATPPGTALMMLDADKMVAAASSRNPTLAGALTRLQRCAFSGSWEVRIVAIQALTTIAIRSGEPFRLQIYEFLYTLAEGGVQSQLSEMHLSNGEDQGASGTGLGVLITPMLKVLDEMYIGQDELIKEIRNHDNANKEWKDEELKKLYENHERLLDFVSMFCYIPRAKYLPLGPISAKLIDRYRTKHNITASTGSTDPAVVATGISDLIYESTQPAPAASNSSGLDDDLVNAWAANLGDDGLLGNNAPAMSRVNEFLAGVGTDAPDVEEENVFSRPSVGYDDMWAKTLLETSELEEEDARSGSSSPDSTGSVESSISSHFGGMNYPSLFSSKPSSQATIREEPPPPYSYSEPQSRESFENPVAGSGSRSYQSDDEEPRKSTGTRFGTALYDFTAGGDDELNLTAEEELEIEYEVDGWFYVKKKRPGRDGKMAGLVPVLYVNQS
ncbi:hypothetical protein CARUB_v10007939mg [Capsella rubella]|uniref:SH3 domain-containing protein n=1 Tax=Capsella rubella TaxID=81985 RepID=R0G731_9BRAS|nr:hypothetical protein CARUB_v10007939mg [Capsella rubella]